MSTRTSLFSPATSFGPDGEHASKKSAIVSSLRKELLRDRLAERLPLLCVAHALVDAAPHDPAGDRADVRSRLVEGLHRDLEPVSGRREDLRRRDVHAVEHHLRGVARALAELVFVLAD